MLDYRSILNSKPTRNQNTSFIVLPLETDRFLAKVGTKTVYILVVPAQAHHFALFFQISSSGVDPPRH